MKKTELKAIRYQLDEGFYVDILQGKKEAEFWLGHQDCDVQEKMFGASPELVSPDRYEEMIASNIEDYLEDFSEAYLED